VSDSEPQSEPVVGQARWASKGRLYIRKYLFGFFGLRSGIHNRNSQEQAEKALRQYLGAMLKDLASQKECRIEEGHLMSDHVYILIAIPPVRRLRLSPASGAFLVYVRH